MSGRPPSATATAPLVPLGQVVVTPSALVALISSGQEARLFLARHLCGDWGAGTPADAQANDRALREADRLLSAYPLQSGQTLWIITEADRSVTTLLLPEDD